MPQYRKGFYHMGTVFTYAFFNGFRIFMFLFGFPMLIGFASRMLLQRFRYAFLGTAALGIWFLVIWLYARTNPIPGSEGPGLLTLYAFCAFSASLVTGMILRIIRAIRSRKNTNK